MMRARPAVRRIAGRMASRLAGFAIAAGLVAALLVPMLVVVLAGMATDATPVDGHVASDAAGIASVAVGGAQRLLAAGRDALPVALPIPSNSSVPIADGHVREPAPDRRAQALPASDAAAACEAARRF